METQFVPRDFLPNRYLLAPLFHKQWHFMKRCDSSFVPHGRCIRQSCFLPDNSRTLYLNAIEEAKGGLSS